MIKRPLNPRFSDAVREGRKFTTIRADLWPVGVPIMLYNWSGAAYRSKQIDVAAIIVQGFWLIEITRMYWPNNKTTNQHNKMSLAIILLKMKNETQTTERLTGETQRSGCSFPSLGSDCGHKDAKPEDICNACGDPFGLSGEDANGYNSSCVHCGNNTYTTRCSECGIECDNDECLPNAIITESSPKKD